MDDDQQFCLRWNNHQSTLVAVFDTLLENGTLVDCTLAAEGKCLNAHKVVLSACSPYFEALLSRHFDKHPILILKDVKFQELKAMMDYMYRGEVNISQDQLGALLKAAESLQIKGLSDNRKSESSSSSSAGDRKPAVQAPPKSPPQATSAIPKVQGLTIEQRNRDDGREGSQSPGPRKKKRLRRKSEDLDNHDASNSSEAHSLPAQNIPSSLPAVSKLNADVPESVETKSEILTRHKQQSDDIPQVPIIKEKLETHTELMLEPKSEYVDEMNEDSIEDLTLDEDDLSNMEQMDDGAGPSHGNAGEGSSQGFGGWHMGNQSQDEVFLAAQEAVGAHRDSQGPKPVVTPKPPAKNIKLEDLKDSKNDENEVARIKKELSTHITFAALETNSQSPKIVITSEPTLPTVVNEDLLKINTEDPVIEIEIATEEPPATEPPPQKVYSVTLIDSTPKMVTRPRHSFSIERMKRFLNMSPDDLPKTAKKKKFKCQDKWDSVKKPIDTLRCAQCNTLYERATHAEHVKACKGLKVKKKFGCTLCSFTDFNMSELESHIKKHHNRNNK